MSSIVILTNENVWTSNSSHPSCIQLPKTWRYWNNHLLIDIIVDILFTDLEHVNDHSRTVLVADDTADMLSPILDRECLWHMLYLSRSAGEKVTKLYGNAERLYKSGLAGVNKNEQAVVLTVVIWGYAKNSATINYRYVRGIYAGKNAQKPAGEPRLFSNPFNTVRSETSSVSADYNIK